MTKRTYMFIDLGIMGAILCFLEFVSYYALKAFPGEVYTISSVMPICFISIMRWGPYGLVHSILGGMVYSLLYGGGAGFLIYSIGNLGVGLCLILLMYFGKEKVRRVTPLTAAYCLAGWVGISAFRAVTAAILTAVSPAHAFVRFLSTDSLSFIIALAAVMIARLQNGLFEDQKAYLLRLWKEETTSGP